MSSELFARRCSRTPQKHIGRRSLWAAPPDPFRMVKGESWVYPQQEGVARSAIPLRCFASSKYCQYL
jgi:hypothetical protein